MFFAQFDFLFSMKKFGQHLLTLVLPKRPNPLKIDLQIGQNHEMTRWPGGFVVLKYQNLLLSTDGVQGVYSTLPKPFDHMWKTYGKIKS